MKSYLQVLKDLREDRDIKQAHVADLLGISQQQFSKYESGVSELPIHMLLKLADFYGLSLDELFNRPSSQATSLQDITGLNKKVRGDYTVGTMISDVLSLNVAGRDSVIEYIQLQKMKVDCIRKKVVADEG